MFLLDHRTDGLSGVMDLWQMNALQFCGFRLRSAMTVRSNLSKMRDEMVGLAFLPRLLLSR
jgi:hypothetical protein